MNIKEKIIFLTLVFIMFGVNLLGIGWGLPSKERNKICFSTKQSLQAHINLLDPKKIKEAWKSWGPYDLMHPEERWKRLPRSLFNPVRSYHPDEYGIIKVLSYMNPKKLKLKPFTFSMGGTQVYLIGLILGILSLVKVVVLTTDIKYYFLNPEAMAHIFLVGRIINAIYATGTIALTYLISRRFCAHRTFSILGCILLGFTPLFILNSHYMYLDIPMLFWIYFAIYNGLNIVKQGKLRSYIFSGIGIGLAAGSKMTAVFSVIILIMAHLLYIYENKSQKFLSKYFLFGILSCAGAFLFSNPFFLFGLHGTAQEVKTLGIISPDFEFYVSALRYGLGSALCILCMIGIGSFLANKKEKQSLLLLGWTVLYFVFISMFTQKFYRYILPVVPCIIIMSVCGINLLWGKFKSLRIPLFIVTAFVCFITFCYGGAYLKLITKKNVRTEAGEWIAENINQSSTIGMTEVPWQYQMPPMDAAKYELMIVGNNYSALQKKKPEYFITSNTQYGFSHTIPEIKKGSLSIGFFHDLFTSREYEIYKVFYNPLSFLGIRFNQFKMSQDLWYINPIIVVLKSKEI
ncbi:glycosyltransferase family 39 protein [bacterium]|nr:glycosyltransferase family 39 protein [bacterium]